MKKKKIIIISVIVLLIVIIFAVILIVRNMNKNKHKVFEEADYPVTYEHKDGNIIVKLNGKKTPNVEWEVRTDDDFVDVTQKGKTSKGNATYIISPKNIGFLQVEFAKTLEISGVRIDLGIMSFPVEISETADGQLIANCYNGPVYIPKDEVVGEETDYPAVINQHYYLSDEYLNSPIKGDIFFVNGQGEWTLESPDGYADFEYYSEDGYDFVYVLRGYGQVEASDSELPPTDYEGEVSESKKQPEPDESKIVDGKVEDGVIVATITDSSPTDSTEMVDSTEVILSNESLGLSETLVVQFKEDGTTSVSKKNDEEK